MPTLSVHPIRRVSGGCQLDAAGVKRSDTLDRGRCREMDERREEIAKHAVAPVDSYDGHHIDSDMTDRDFSESRQEKLEGLADELGVPRGEVVETVTDVEYLKESVDSFAEAATVKRAFLEDQLEKFEQSLKSLRSERIEVDIDGIVLRVGDDLNETLEEYGIPRLRKDRPFVEFRRETKEVAYDMADHPFIEIRTVGDGLRYSMSEVNADEIRALSERLRDSERGLVRITNGGRPVIAEAGAPDATPYVDESSVLVEVNEIDRSEFCRAVVNYGAGDEVFDWVARHSLNVSKELQYRYGSVREIERDGKLLYGWRDDKEAFASGAATGDDPKTLLRVNQYPGMDDAAPTVGMEVYDAETDDLLTVLHSESGRVLAALAAEFLQGAFWLKDETAE